MNLLESVELRKTFRKREVVRGVSVTVRSGEVVGLLGPNGAGKTTTFSMILGLLRPDSGQIRLNDAFITMQPVYRRARLGISFLPQEPSIIRGLTARENLEAVLQLVPGGRQRVERIPEVMDEMGITRVAGRRAGLLSGGERRRLEIARALLLDPVFLLLDEPFAGIDTIQIREIQDLVVALSRRGLGIIITDHNVREILRITTRSYIINRGSVICQGPPSVLVENPQVQREYLGEGFRWN